MITCLAHLTVHVVDQDRAKAFYLDKLGFELRSDREIDGRRWITVGPPMQPLTSITLAALPEMSGAETLLLRGLIERGKFGAGVLQTADIHAGYAILNQRAVSCTPPTERPYGTEVLFQDDSGYWWSMVQPRPAATWSPPEEPAAPPPDSDHTTP